MGLLVPLKDVHHEELAALIKAEKAKPDKFSPEECAVMPEDDIDVHKDHGHEHGKGV